ncbi:MAG: hypothetical protein HYR96_05030 [Deltaproteobacteria bacterium]|nr:hypothetical protein [Deltaproteobacteria bacterium]MBI3294549.1 hypothetical protein [Deltaproteobacteria bacterium]
MDPKIREKLSELRSIEKKAKQLIFRMRRLEEDWEKVRKELAQAGQAVDRRLGDALAGWNKA